ncbi:MAG: HlyD family efflux transporter periplasmic adaptor subunit [Lachnospiraceae bacterium]|nr:HlyD family efflux transporter periplasmic adaptor subunit [Lachnospiraceae bacterium]
MKKVFLTVLALALVVTMTACGESGESVSVQSVAMICGTGNVGIAERFAGVVSSRSEINVELTDGRKAGEIIVAEGDDVEAGQVLFTYDTEAQQINFEKAQLELEQMKNAIESKKKTKESLEKEKNNASSDQKLQYSLEIQECETEIREQEYNMAIKEKELARLEEAVSDTQYICPITGRVKSVNPDGGYDQQTGEQLPFMSIVETGAYQVKGYVNEMNAQVLGEGMDVIVRSRSDKDVIWKGSVDRIDWENPQKSGNNFYYYDGGGSSDTSSSSKYPFYIELDDSEGLILGQHVFIEPDYGQGVLEDAGKLHLPSMYLFDTTENSGYVWAENGSGRLEKRKVSLGSFDSDMETYVIEDGLTEDDYIAFPEETLQEGMVCERFDPESFEPGEFPDSEMPVDGEFNVEEGNFGDGEFYGDDGNSGEDGFFYENDGGYGDGMEGGPVLTGDEPVVIATAAPMG